MIISIAFRPISFNNFFFISRWVVGGGGCIEGGCNKKENYVTSWVVDNNTWLKTTEVFYLAEMAEKKYVELENYVF